MRIVFITMFALLGAWLFNNKTKILVTLQDRYYFLLFIAICISAIKVGWLEYILDTYNDTLKLALIYFFIVTIINTEARLIKAIWSIVFLFALVAVLGILQYFGHDITGIGMIWAPDKEVWQIRGIGNFDNPNDLAYSVVIVIPFAIGMMLFSDAFLKKAFGAGLFLIGVYAIYLTQSRGGYLALVICLAAWVYFLFNKVYLKRFAMLMAVGGVIYMGMSITSGYKEDESSMGRIEAWVAGMEMLSENPVTGVGKNQFAENHKRDSHNSYVRAGSELGFIGLFAFIGILVSAFRTMTDRTILMHGMDWRIYNLSFICYLASYMTGSLFSSRVYDIVFMIMVAITSVFKRMHSINTNIINQDGYPVEGTQATAEKLISMRVIFYTLLAITIWKLFLMQV
jgi:O-antigen ligase